MFWLSWCRTQTLFAARKVRFLPFDGFIVGRISYKSQPESRRAYDKIWFLVLVVQQLVGAICMDLINIHASSYRSQLSFQQQKKRHIFKAKQSSDKTIQLDWMTLVWTAWKSLPFSWSMHDFWLHEKIHQWQENCSNSWSACLWSQKALTFKEHFLPEKLGTKLWTDKPWVQIMTGWRGMCRQSRGAKIKSSSKFKHFRRILEGPLEGPISLIWMDVFFSWPLQWNAP